MIRLDRKMNVITRARLSPMAGARFAARVAAEIRRCQSTLRKSLVNWCGEVSQHCAQP